MGKIKLLVTGLALLNLDVEKDGCSVCNYDYEWLLKQPSSLIWADKIIVPPNIYKTIEIGSFPEEKIGQSIQKIFEVSKDFNLLEIKSAEKELNYQVVQNISDEIVLDRVLLTKLFPDKIKEGNEESVPGQLFVEDTEYCSVRLRTVYASLYLAKKWKAESLFSDDVYNYCKYKFGLSLIENRKSSYEAFQDLFNIVSPEKSLFPSYLFRELKGSRCNTCKNEEYCEKNFLKIVENNVHQYLELRDYDEIQQIKGTIQEVIRKLDNTKSVYTQNDIIRAFRKQERVINKDLKSTFPKIQRWSKISLIISVPTILYGMATGLPSVSYLGASIAGISEGVQKMLEYSESKYKWVAFMQKREKEKMKIRIKK